MSALRPFFSYFGSKWRSIPRYPEPCGRIIEPFAGSASYSVRYPDHDVLLVDSDEFICGVWRYLIAVSPGELLALPDLCIEQTVDDLAVPQEARWLIGFWINTGNPWPCKRLSASARKSVDEWRASYKGSSRPLFWGARVRERLARQVAFIRHWKVVCADYRSAPDVDATWFVDPPYVETGVHYRKRIDDYAALASWCRTRRGKVIVCEGGGATWLPFRRLCEVRTNNVGRKGGYGTEAVWLA